MSKANELEKVIQWEQKLNASRYAIEMLEVQAEKMPTDSPQQLEFIALIYNARYSLSAAYMGLAIKKAKLGIVGQAFYVPE